MLQRSILRKKDEQKYSLPCSSYSRYRSLQDWFLSYCYPTSKRFFCFCFLKPQWWHVLAFIRGVPASLVQVDMTLFVPHRSPVFTVLLALFLVQRCWERRICNLICITTAKTIWCSFSFSSSTKSRMSPWMLPIMVWAIWLSSTSSPKPPNSILLPRSLEEILPNTSRIYLTWQMFVSPYCHQRRNRRSSCQTKSVVLMLNDWTE